MNLETREFYLRRFIPEDREALFQLNTHPEVMRYIGDLWTPEIVDIRLQKVISAYEKYPGLGAWPAIRKSDEAWMGWFCLNHLDQTEEIEIGYRLFPSYWGKGIASSGSRLLVRYGFEELGLDRVVGVVNPDNKASIRVLEKTGLRQKGRGWYYGRELLYYELSQQTYHTS